MPFGTADPKETPPRMPFIMPVYHLTLLPANETSALSLGEFQVPVGKVMVEDQTVRLVENYIPPCTAVNSHYELLEVHAVWSSSLVKWNCTRCNHTKDLTEKTTE